jgi:hypothetical protein
MTEKPELKEKEIRILWSSDDDLPSLYANHLYVSHAGDTEFHLIFGHLSPPITLNLKEDELPENVIIKPVAKLVIGPKAMEAFLTILNDNWEKFDERQKGEKNE